MTASLGNTNRRGAIKAAAAASLLPIVGSPVLRAASMTEEVILGPGRNQNFDIGWRFHKGDGEGFELPGADDTAWRRVDLPHDWSIEDLASGEGRIGPFDPASPGAGQTGFAVGGEGWYRKHFRLADLTAGGGAHILFDGVYMEADVWINGKHLGQHVHGYMPFHFDLTPHLVPGGRNILALRVRNVGLNSRWYSGSGIYRPVTIDVFLDAPRISRWGVCAWTRRFANGQAEIEVTTSIDDASADLALRTRLRDVDGRVAAEHTVPASARVSQTLRVASPKLWSPDCANLYTLETELLRQEKIVDRATENFGIRIVSFDASDGMRINGQQVKIRGGCVHHSNGILGAMAFPDAEDRRVRQLKARGFNAVRSSHNPPSFAFRQACERHGLLLISEAFDMWHAPKNPDDYALHFPSHWREDIEAMVLSARNSPSVVMWSVGNEIPKRGTREGVQWSWRLANAVRQLDPTRPVTAAIHCFIGRTVVANDIAARPGFAGKEDETTSVFMDVVGYNYKLDDIENIHAERPERIIYASETYPRDVFGYADLMRRRTFFLGEFVWTAMDYLGEAALGATRRFPKDNPDRPSTPWPWVNAFCGDIDLCGAQKPQSLARDVAWGLSPLEVLVERPLALGEIEEMMPWAWPDELSSWTWPVAEGTPMKVRVYTMGESVDLFLDGQAVGTRRLEGARRVAEFIVPYHRGTLEARAMQGGRQIGTRAIETTGAPTMLRLALETKEPARGRDRLCYLGLELCDAHGRQLPEGEADVRLRIAGPAELIAFGNAAPEATGSFRDERHRIWRGRALAILRATGEAGTVRVEATAPGLRGAATSIELR